MAPLCRTEAAASRQRHEDRHMGAFSRIYPPQDPVRQALYAQALQVAAAAFAGSMKAKAHSTIERLQVGVSNCGACRLQRRLVDRLYCRRSSQLCWLHPLSASWHWPAHAFRTLAALISCCQGPPRLHRKQHAQSQHLRCHPDHPCASPAEADLPAAGFDLVPTCWCFIATPERSSVRSRAS